MLGVALLADGQRVPPPPKNVTQSEMQTVFGVGDVAAGYIPPNRVPMKKPAAADNKAAGTHPDTVDVLRGKWLDNQWSNPYDTEVKSQFYNKKSSYKKMDNDLKMTASNVVMTNPADAPWPYHTTSASFQVRVPGDDASNVCRGARARR